MLGPSVRRTSRWTCARRTALGQEHHRLPGRVAAADHRDILCVVEVRFHRRAGVVDPRAGKAVRAVGLQAPPTHPQGQQQDPTADFRPAVQLQRVPVAARPGGGQLFDGDRGDHPGAELEHLQNAARRQVGPAQPGGEADEVLDARGAAGLPARPELVQQQRGKPLGRRVHGRGDSRRPGADDGEIDFLRRAVAPDARLAGQLLQGGVHEDAAVAAFNDRRLARRAQCGEHCAGPLPFPCRTT